jgi:hypothetical protein
MRYVDTRKLVLEVEAPVQTAGSIPRRISMAVDPQSEEERELSKEDLKPSTRGST